jgi:hypothetical protein
LTIPIKKPFLAHQDVSSRGGFLLTGHVNLSAAHPLDLVQLGTAALPEDLEDHLTVDGHLSGGASAIPAPAVRVADGGHQRQWVHVVGCLLVVQVAAHALKRRKTNSFKSLKESLNFCY